ncbi:Rhodanese domain-containing protein [Candidatus Bealeia paramacronuclearis]|uniref:tRNA uridine(34) hydroxylase n=1 Tax=Candidatus Bealeia paramacronuclearis TaxID=1921001 RepID=A0ABZ2C6L8_9PROT|nr:Rhodanese domain-containing protein [Candidatus Bealeia paramacronuclearis]
MIRVAALYKFVKIEDIQKLQVTLKSWGQELEIKGTLLVAHEGINGTVAGIEDNIHELLKRLQNDPRFSDVDYKLSWSEDYPFYRLKVRLKKEIVTIGIPEVDPTEKVGTYVSPQEWNKIISDPNVIVLDTRNDYEVEIGTFKNAIDPKTKTFREFPKFVKDNIDPKKYSKVAMFCTGGIRCEKASSYMLQEGFEEVYHLKGGILKYLEDMPKEQSLWEGDCFVFDGRVSLAHALEFGHHESCFGCRNPITEEDKSSPFYERGVSCPHCYHHQTEKQKMRARERQRQQELAAKRGQKHIGAVMPKLGPQV